MNTSIIYIDTQSSSYVTSEEHIRLLSSYGILKMIYKDLKVDDGEESLVKMIDKIQNVIGLEGMKGNVLIVGTLTSRHCMRLDKLLNERPNWTFISTIASSTRMNNLLNGFSIHYNDIHVVSSLILLTESLYPQVLIITDDMFGMDLYQAYSNSLTSQIVKLQVMNERTPSLDKIESYINSPNTIIVSAMLGSRYDELLDIVDHDRLISLNPWRIDENRGKHLVVRPSTPYPEKFGYDGLDGMLVDVMEFCTRIKKIEGRYDLDKSKFVQLWNQFATDMKSSLSFFRNCTIDPTLNIPRIFGVKLISNKRLMDIDSDEFNKRNCETFRQSIMGIYIRHESRTPIEYWNSIHVIPTKLITIKDEDTDDILFQRFSDSITLIDDDKILVPHCGSLPVKLDVSQGEVKGISTYQELDIFSIEPSTETQYIIQQSIEDNTLDSLLSRELDDIEFDEDLDDHEYTIEPNLDFYHSIIA